MILLARCDNCRHLIPLLDEGLPFRCVDCGAIDSLVYIEEDEMLEGEY